MARFIELGDRALHIRLSGWHAVFAISSGLTVPYRAIRSVSAAPSAIPRPMLRLGGGALPFTDVYGGRFWNRDGWMFFSFEHRSRAVTLTLDPGQPGVGRYRWVVFGSAHPATTREHILARIGSHR